MPLAQIYVPEGALTLDQKRAMIKGVTDVIAGVEKFAGHGYVLQEFPQLIAGKPILPAAS
jgi:hypothetical protein